MRRLIAPFPALLAAARGSRERPADAHPPGRHAPPASTSPGSRCPRRRPSSTPSSRRAWRPTCSSAWPAGPGSSRWPTPSSSSTRRARPSARSTPRPASTPVPPAHQPLARGRRGLRRRASPSRSASPRATRRSRSRCATSTASARGPGAASTSPRRPRRSTRPSTTRPRRASLHQPLTRVRAKVNANDLRARLQHRHHDRPGALQAAPVQGPEVPQELRRRRRPAGLPDAHRALRHPEQAGQPGVVGAQLARGPASCRARRWRAAAPPTRSRRAGWASPTASASTAPARTTRSASRASHGCIRMHVADVIDLFTRVPVGTPVLIQ